MTLATSFDDYMTQLSIKNPDLWKMNNYAPGYAAVNYNAAINGWSQEQVDGWLHGTQYWTQNSDNARAWDILSWTDPASAEKRLIANTQQINDISKSMGYSFSNGEEYLGFINTATRENWDPARVRREVAGHILYRGTWGVPGAADYINDMVAQRPEDFGAFITGVSKLSSDYGVPVSSGAMFEHAANLLGGIETQEGVEQEIRNWAKGFYTGNEQIINAIDSGVSLRQYADPFMQLSVNELEMNPSAWSLMDDKWRTAIDYQDPTTGVRRPMSLSEWTVKMRNDAQYGYDSTANGQKQAATLTSSLAQQFGAMG